MSRLLENRVVKLEDRQCAQGPYADWSHEQLMARIVELNEVISRSGQSFEELVAAGLDINEVEKAQAVAHHRMYSPDYSRKI